jgi:enoyl-CoA hydratase
MSGRLDIREEGGILRVILDNPARRNAMTLAMWEALGDLCADPPAARVVMLEGAGDRAFCAGADISEFEAVRATPEAIQRYDAAVARAEEGLSALPIPVIAKIRGACVGGGLGLAARCDMRIAGETARFGVTPAKLGLGYSFREVALIERLVGPAVAAEMLYTGRIMAADEAARAGLTNRVVPEAALDETAGTLAAAIAANAPLTIRAVKASLIAAGQDPAARDLDGIAEMVRACYASEDYAEGRRAFAEKRPPVFRGR